MHVVELAPPRVEFCAARVAPGASVAGAAQLALAASIVAALAAMVKAPSTVP